MHNLTNDEAEDGYYNYEHAKQRVRSYDDELLGVCNTTKQNALTKVNNYKNVVLPESNRIRIQKIINNNPA